MNLAEVNIYHSHVGIDTIPIDYSFDKLSILPYVDSSARSCKTTTGIVGRGTIQSIIYGDV